LLNQVGQAIDKLFEPARRASNGLADLAKASDSLLQLSGSAFRLFESLKDFRDHMRKLSSSFASMRTFQNDLGVLAESFEPAKLVEALRRALPHSHDLELKKEALRLGRELLRETKYDEER
jgi:hypothetical protein